MTNKEKYRQRSWEDIPLFLQPWWLDLVAQDQWDVCLLENPEEIYAVMPYVIAGSSIRMPALTPFLGPWWKIYSDKYAKKISNEVNYLNELFEQLPPFARFEQRWYYTRTNWLPMYWSGFSQTTKYHYVIGEISDSEIVWNNMKDKMRKQIRNAEKELKIHSDGTIEELYRQWMMTFGKQKMETPLSVEVIKNIYEECINRQSGKIFFAEDEMKNIHGALFIVWDKHSVYGLISGADPKYKSSAPTLLLWQGIQIASKMNLPFNFCGSMIKPIENYLRDFGGIQMPYFEISKINSKWQKFKQGAGLILQSMKSNK